jgi:hypothetical protein
MTILGRLRRGIEGRLLETSRSNAGPRRSKWRGREACSCALPSGGTGLNWPVVIPGRWWLSVGEAGSGILRTGRTGLVPEIQFEVGDL